MSAGFHRGGPLAGMTLGDLFGDLVKERGSDEGFVGVNRDVAMMRTIDGEDGYPSATIICALGSKAATFEWLFAQYGASAESPGDPENEKDGQ